MEMSRRIWCAAAGVLVLILGVAAPAPRASQAQTPAGRPITTPFQQFGHNFGDDYFLANYQQISSYWKQLAGESNRIVLQNIGKTAEGRDQLMAIVTSPANHKNLARYKEISRRLAFAEGLTDEQARALAKEGKAVVWIDGGLHANEVLGAQQLGEMVYQMVSRTDDETMRLLDDVVTLFVHANPDGNDLVADWYMRNPVPEQRSAGNLPKLYQKYIGHDNNRDFFGSTQAETENMNRVLYHEWFPQLLYNHHQSGPQGTILYSPPFRDPFNYNEDPLAVLGMEQMGNAIHMRLAAEGKPGATMRSGGPYDGWWNGGIRNTTVFHNTVAILTEMVGSPTPMNIPLVVERQVPNSDYAYPVAPQVWHFRQSIDYSISCNRAILDLASRMKENYLFNRYVMGKRSIDRGNADTWTPKPHRYARIQAELGRGAAPAALWTAMHRPEDRDPRGFIISANQTDFPTAVKFINALRETGIIVKRATAAFAVAGKNYPAGSLIVPAAQAFRPHVIDMFEPQDHPDNFPIPGGPPMRPYDVAGWTLAYQMGIDFDRIMEPFTGPFENVTDWNLKPPAGHPIPAGNGSISWVGVRPQQLDAFTAVNRLLTDGKEVQRSQSGEFVLRNNASNEAVAAKLMTELGVNIVLLDARADLKPLSRPRVGLWDQYGGSMDAGWARWILEQFEFKFDRVFAPELDAGNLNAKYDVLIFVGGGIPAAPGGDGGGGGRAGGGRAGGRGAGAAGAANAGAAATAGQAASAATGQAAPAGQGRGGGRGAGAAAALPIPAEYLNQVGSVTAATTLPQLKQFIENGGTVIALDSSATNLARYLGLPMSNHLVEPSATSDTPPTPLPQSKFYAPGSVLRAHVDTTSPAAFGMKADTDFFFDNSQVWKLGPDAAARNVKPIAWFNSKTPLRSGWAWGQEYLDGGVIAVSAGVGRGRVFLFGAEILQRGQPHATFKLLFNSIYAK
jgi:hypothetical protein